MQNFLMLLILPMLIVNSAYGYEQESYNDSMMVFSDTQTLHVYGESKSPSQNPFVEFHEGEVIWLDRVVRDKAILMSDFDISQYLDLIGHDEIGVKYVTDDNSVTYYALRLSDPSLDLKEHNVRTFYQYFKPEKFTEINLDEDDIPQYLRYILAEREWTILSDEQYYEIKEQIKENEGYFQVIREDHAPNFYKIAYIGPETKEVKEGLFKNKQNSLQVNKTMFSFSPQYSSCTPVSSHNAANESLPYHERFNVKDDTGKDVWRIDDGNKITIRYNPYNDWAEHTPFLFEFKIKYYDGSQWLTVHSERNSIKGSLCDVTEGFEWSFTPKPGEYEFVIDRINSGDDEDFDEQISVDKNNIYNALVEDPKFLQKMTGQGFAEPIYKVSSAAPGEIGLNIEEVEWSPDDSFILFKQHDRCSYVDYSKCVSESIWRLDLVQDAIPQKIQLDILDRYGSVDELKISPDGRFVAMRGYYTEDESSVTGLFLYDLEQRNLQKIIDGVKTHITSFDWMPDGTILYHESVGQNSGILWNLDLDGNLSQVYKGEPNFGYMDVSPDGTKVSFRAIEKEPGRSPPPGPEAFDPPGIITWFDIPTKEFFDGQIRYNMYAQTEWSPDSDYLYYIGIRPSPPMIGKLDLSTGEDTPVVISDYPLRLSSSFSFNPTGNLMTFALDYDEANEYESIIVMDAKNPPKSMVEFSKSEIKGLMCGTGKVLLNEQCVSETFAEQQGCLLVNGNCLYSENMEKLYEAHQSMRSAFANNVEIEGYPIRDIVLGYGIGDGKYVIDVNSDFFNSQSWSKIQQNLTNISGNDVDVDFREGKPLTICGEGTELVDGVCQVITQTEATGDCLIATASFGSKLAPQVQMLREVRDNTLLSTYSGSIFMNGFNSVYYSFSPAVADWENENPVFREAVKIFITPMILALSIMTLAEEGSELQVILYGISTIGAIFGMYVVAPASLVWKARKRG